MTALAAEPAEVKRLKRDNAEPYTGGATDENLHKLLIPIKQAWDDYTPGNDTSEPVAMSTYERPNG